jgi:hypothetical protein
VDELDKIYRDYHKNVNMTCKGLKKWEGNPCSKKASLSTAPLKRNLRLLCKPKSRWTSKDIRDAKRTIAFNKRMKGVVPGKPAVKGCPSKRNISLLNWAWDPR